MARHVRQSIFACAEKIREEIESETMRFLAGKGKAVAPDPIQLTVYSPVVPNLTLVDMPGLTLITARSAAASRNAATAYCWSSVCVGLCQHTLVWLLLSCRSGMTHAVCPCRSHQGAYRWAAKEHCPGPREHGPHIH